MEKIKLTQEQHDKISEFKSRLESTGLVSQQMVVSLEEFIGFNVYTDTVKQRFTDAPSSIGASDLIRRSNVVLQNSVIDTIGIVTYGEYAAKIAAVYEKLRNLKYRIETLSKLSSETIARMYNEKSIYTYFDENNRECDSVRNIPKDIGIFETLANRRDYLASVIGKDDSSRLNRYYNIISDFYADQSNYGVDMTQTPLLGLLIDSEAEGLTSVYHGYASSYKKVTLNDIVELSKSTTKIIERIENTMTHLQNDLHWNSKDLIERPADGDDWNTKYLKQDYDDICNFDNILSDPVSLLVLELMAAIIKD